MQLDRTLKLEKHIFIFLRAQNKNPTLCCGGQAQSVLLCCKWRLDKKKKQSEQQGREEPMNKRSTTSQDEVRRTDIHLRTYAKAKRAYHKEFFNEDEDGKETKKSVLRGYSSVSRIQTAHDI